jgi:mRNA interferase HigB
LRAWYKSAREADWKGPAGVKADHPTVSILKSGRVVFNIGGNKFRLVVAIRYEKGVIFIRFIGTHGQYDRIDAQEI